MKSLTTVFLKVFFFLCLFQCVILYRRYVFCCAKKQKLHCKKDHTDCHNLKSLVDILDLVDNGVIKITCYIKF